MTSTNIGRIVNFVGGDHARLPSDVLNAAKMCLVDWLAVCLGARSSAEARSLEQLASKWDTRGKAVMLTGGTAAPSMAALVNGTLSHCLDYDDTHIPSLMHASGPTWATLLALGTHEDRSEDRLLQAYVVGYEVGTRLGNHGIGLRLTESGWHATPILGRFSSVAAGAALRGLDEDSIAHAMGLAGTQAGGLTASFGTMAKPFHAGKAAMDAIVSLDLAQAGLVGATDLFDSHKGVFPTLCQDRNMTIDVGEFGQSWEILNNSFKPYAACQLTHAAIDAGRRLRPRLADHPIESITAFVHPLAIQVAGLRNARTATEGKFSLGYCVALALEGYPVTTEDFGMERLSNSLIADIADRVQLVASSTLGRTGARLEVRTADGISFVEVVEDAFGSKGNPMGWPHLQEKFSALVEPVLGGETTNLLEILHAFEKPGALRRVIHIVDAGTKGGAGHR